MIAGTHTLKVSIGLPNTVCRNFFTNLEKKGRQINNEMLIAYLAASEKPRTSLCLMLVYVNQ
jgi:hypothetical protein